MKKLATMLTLALVMLTLGSTAMAGGPWEVKVEGNGIVSGGALPNYGVTETDIGWNMKKNVEGEIQGRLNIVEKLDGGTTRHFQLSGDEVGDVGVFFDCDTHEVRVEGYNSKGELVAAHFRGSQNASYPNTVWYWVKDSDGKYITNTNARLELSNPFTVECAE